VATAAAADLPIVILIAVMGTAAFLLIINAIVIAFFFYRKKRRSSKADKGRFNIFFTVLFSSVGCWDKLFWEFRLKPDNFYFHTLV
jgi:amino acid transporter